MATLDEVKALQLKIATAKAERDALAKSIDPTDKNSWWVSLQNNCGVTWQPNKSSPACSPTFKCTGLVDCPTIWNLITSRKQKIAEDDANILLWQGQVDALLKSPDIQQSLIDQEKNRQLRNGVIWVVVISAIIGVAFWAWKKYGK